MIRRLAIVSAVLVLVGTAGLTVASPAAAQAGPETDIQPPWCGDPVPDAAENLPDGTDPSDPAGSFPHIPYYAIRCTLEDIVASSQGRMSLEVIGQSALGRDMFLVTVNALDTAQQRKDFQAWQQVRKVALTDPARGQELLAVVRGRRQGPDLHPGRHPRQRVRGRRGDLRDAGASWPRRRTARTPRSTRSWTTRVLLFNVIQNPDGRVAGTRANGNGFDLNRDFMTQSQTETRASVAVMQKWLPPEMLDLHGYVTPTLDRGDDQAAQPEHRLRPVAEVEPAAHRRERGRPGGARLRRHPAGQRLVLRRRARPASGICPDGEPPGPAEAEGWDDWGPFYTPMYAQHVGLNGSTVEMCNQTDNDCASAGHDAGRAAAGWGRGSSRRPWSGRRLLFDLDEPQRAAARRARALPPRRHERAAAAVLRAAVRRRQQLDGGVPHRLHRPDG